MRHAILIMACVILILIATNVFSEGFYVGAGIGNTFFSSEVQDALDQAREISDNSTAWKIFGGFHLTNFLNLEGGYRSFGNISSEISSDLFEIKTTGWDIEAQGQLKIIVVDLFAEAGIMFWSSDVTFLGRSLDESGNDFFWGIGVGAHLGPIGARLEWESVEIGSPDNLSMVSLSATFGF